MKIPMVLSGNFGEVRSNHFHSGIDIKTGGTIGHHVFAIEEGYVSRIKVQANGYGKSVYLTHPNGYTSVYGHLDSYRDDLAGYVKKVQYQRRSHQVDIFPDPGLFRVDRGEFIGYSGNTGGSLGPHLHFEVRTSADQHPTNVLKYGFPITDRTPPRFLRLIVDPLGEGLLNGQTGTRVIDLVPDKGIYTVPWGTRLDVSGRVGLSVEVYDYLDGASNRCGVYTLEAFVRDTLRHSFRMDEFSFSETRYVNAHIHYPERMRSGAKARRLYRLPNDRLRIYGTEAGDGVLRIEPGEAYPVHVIATDVSGNRSELKFVLRGVQEKNPRQPGDQNNPQKPVSWNQSTTLSFEGIEVRIPAGALYEDIGFTYQPGVIPAGSPPEATLTPFHRIHEPSTPLHRPFTLVVPVENVPVDLSGKLTLVSWDPEEERMIAAGGSFSSGLFTASLRSFGDYAVSLDTVAPEIHPENGTLPSDLSGKKRIRFTVRDDLTDVSEYNGYINNRWVLFEYDPKNERLTYTFDPSRLESGREHELELYVTDGVGNVNLFHSTFTW